MSLAPSTPLPPSSYRARLPRMAVDYLASALALGIFAYFVGTAAAREAVTPLFIAKLWALAVVIEVAGALLIGAARSRYRDRCQGVLLDNGSHLAIDAAAAPAAAPSTYNKS